MFPISFDEANHVSGPPKNMPDADPLNIFMTKDGDEVLQISCWKLTEEELNIINNTGRVYLLVRGRKHPVVGLLGMNPCAEYPVPPEDDRD